MTSHITILNPPHINIYLEIYPYNSLIWTPSHMLVYYPLIPEASKLLYKRSPA